MRGLLVALVFLPFALACNSAPPRPSDGLDDYRFRSNGPVWGRLQGDGRLRTLFWDLPADDSGMVSAERAVLRLLGLDLGLTDPDRGTRVLGTVPIGPDGTMTIFQVVHLGVDVVGAQIRIVRVGDRIRFVSAQIPPPILLDVEPMVDAAEVMSTLPMKLGLMETPPMSEPRLVVMDSSMMLGLGGAPLLAWEVLVHARPGGGRVFVSAITGEVMQVLATREEFADVYFVRQSEDDFEFTSGSGIRDHWFSAMSGALVDPPPAEPAATAFSEAALAHMDAEALRSYFLDNFGWDGYDNMGGQSDVFVGYSTTCAGCPNAYWAGLDYTGRQRGVDEFAEYFTFSNGFYSSDVFAHEYTHALLDYATDSEPFNFGEPGAVEESLADTFAAFFDTASPWLIGDNLPAPMQRDLRTPGDNELSTLCPAQPEHMNERYPLEPVSASCDLMNPGECGPANDQICLGGLCYAREGGGFAHCDSSIPSLAAYRLTDGDPAASTEGMGVAKAQVIYFTALQLIGRWETLHDLRDHLLASCLLWAQADDVEIPGAGEPMQPGDCADVINAFHSVGLGTFPDTDRDGWDDVSDNCPLTPNFDQRDADFDQVGDVCVDGEEPLPSEGYFRCFWADAQHCVHDNDPRMLLMSDCTAASGGEWESGLCPPGGSACIDDRGDRVIARVFYDGDAIENEIREMRCDASTERWESDYSP